MIKKLVLYYPFNYINEINLYNYSVNFSGTSSSPEFILEVLQNRNILEEIDVKSKYCQFSLKTVS